MEKNLTRSVRRTLGASLLLLAFPALTYAAESQSIIVPSAGGDRPLSGPTENSTGTTGDLSSRAGDYRKTEWIWLMSVYAEEVEDLAAATSAKYRQSLKLPADREVTLAEWLEDQPVTRQVLRSDRSRAQPIQVDSPCLAAARAEFRSRLKRLDEAVAKAFAEWAKVSSGADARAVVALWEAADSMNNLARARGDQWIGDAMLYSEKKLAALGGGAAAKLIKDQAVQALSESIPLVQPRGVMAWISKAAAEQAQSQGEEYLKKQITANLQTVLTRPNGKSFRDVAGQLQLAANKKLLDVAYKTHPNAKEEMWALDETGRSGALKPNYYALNGPTIRKAGFHTGLGLHIAEEDVLLKKIEGMEWVVDGRVVRKYRLSELKDAFENRADLPPAVITNLNQQEIPITKWSGNFGQLREEYLSYRDLLQKEYRAGEAEWFGTIGRGAAGGFQDKLQALAAVRLLRADLQTFIEGNFARQVKKQAIATLASRMAGLEFLKILGPLKDALESALASAVQGAVDAVAPDRVQELAERLDRESYRIALNLGLKSAVPPVVLEREQGLAAMLALNSQLPASCTQQRTAAPGKAVWIRDPTIFASNNTPGRMPPALQVTEGALQFSEEREGKKYSNSMKWSVPPATITTGDPVELSISASAGPWAVVNGWYNLGGGWRITGGKKQNVGSNFEPHEAAFTMVADARANALSVQVSAGHDPSPDEWIVITWTYHRATPGEVVAPSASAASDRKASVAGSVQSVPAPAKPNAASPPVSPTERQREAARAYSAGRTGDAIILMRQALEADPQAWSGWMNLAEMLAEESRWEEAEAALRRTLDTNLPPGLEGPLRIQLAQALLNQGKRDQAVQEALAARKQGVPRHPIFQRLGLP